MKLKLMKYMVATLAIGFHATANAAIIVPTAVTSTGGASEPGDAGTSLSSLINGNGLSGTPTDDGTTAGGITHGGTLTDHWVTTDPGAGGGDYFADVAGTLQLDFVLGGSFDLTTAYIWGYGFSSINAMKNSATVIDVSYSSDGTTFTNTETINISLPTATTTPVDVSALNAPTGTTHVRFLFTDNGFDGTPGGDRTGLGEVRFGGTISVPEPSSTALLGLGALALILRRRK